MAINIFQGASGKSKKVNSASNSTRAQAAKAALTGAAETSGSGSTAVKTSGTLGKVGNFVGKAAGIASKFLPGVGGAIAKGVANLFNDPEWWQSVPGDAITLNAPLSMAVPTGKLNTEDQAECAQMRPAFLELVSISNLTDQYLIEPTVNMVTQYLMPEVRKVVNAIPLQEAGAYTAAFSSNATIYALWRNLKKYDYMLKHGTTYIPNMNEPAFPVFQTTNAAWLQSTINRLEEYLRANVRLPHTLCEYLAWRFGRVYKSNSSAKSALVLYSVLPITASIADYDEYIRRCFAVISSTAAIQQANTDLYNAYIDHDMAVEIRDDTQFVFDYKEFMLRTNCDFLANSSDIAPTLNPVIIDSSMDNPTTFMASTISTIGYDASAGVTTQLIKTQYAFVYSYYAKNRPDNNEYIPTIFLYGTYSVPMWLNINSGSYWFQHQIVPTVGSVSNASIIGDLVACKAVDLYNAGIYARLSYAGEDNDNLPPYVDLTSISYDMGTVTDEVIAVEQTYAFANLVDISRKTSMSYAKAEKLVAKDTAELIEKLDVAAVNPDSAIGVK